MDVKIWVAIIAASSAVITSGIALYTARSQARRDFVSKSDLADKDFVAKSGLVELEDEPHREREDRQREFDAETVLARYRDPLIHATFFLQQRLFQILRVDGKDYGPYLRGSSRQEIALKSTLYRFAEYLAWREIVRREIQFLNLAAEGETRRVQRLTGDISRILATDDAPYETDFMLWVEVQRAIAELMIVRDGALTTCLGFASFVEQFARFDPWFKEFESQLTLVDLPRQRLTELFNLLLTLGHALDPDGVRYEWHSWQERDANGRVIGKLR